MLQAGFRRASGAGRRTRDALMVVEMALSVALVAVSALLIQSLLAVQQAPLGFDASNVFTLQFRLPQTKYATPEDIARFFKSARSKTCAPCRACSRRRSSARFRSAATAARSPTTIEGQPEPDPASAPQALFHLVTPDYFKTMRIPILKGRDFTDRDDLQTPLVAVVNDTFARRVWPGRGSDRQALHDAADAGTGHHRRRGRRRQALHLHRAAAGRSSTPRTTRCR